MRPGVKPRLTMFRITAWTSPPSEISMRERFMVHGFARMRVIMVTSRRARVSRSRLDRARRPCGRSILELKTSAFFRT